MFFSSTSAAIRVLPRPGIRLFSASKAHLDRAIAYSQNGDPSQVLTALTYPPPPPPGPDTINIKFLLSPVNPSDVNVVEGIYPSKPARNDALATSGKGSKDEPVFVGGNEGLAQVTDVGSGVSGFQKGDWVIMTKQQLGTWSTSKNVGAGDILKVQRLNGVSEVHGATLTVCLYDVVSPYALYSLPGEPPDGVQHAARLCESRSG